MSGRPRRICEHCFQKSSGGIGRQSSRIQRGSPSPLKPWSRNQIAFWMKLAGQPHRDWRVQSDICSHFRAISDCAATNPQLSSTIRKIRLPILANFFRVESTFQSDQREQTRGAELPPQTGHNASRKRACLNAGKSSELERR